MSSESDFRGFSDDDAGWKDKEEEWEGFNDSEDENEAIISDDADAWRTATGHQISW